MSVLDRYPGVPVGGAFYMKAWLGSTPVVLKIEPLGHINLAARATVQLITPNAGGIDSFTTDVESLVEEICEYADAFGLQLVRGK